MPLGARGRLMAKQILQINFNYSVEPNELGKDFGPLAEPIANVPGLQWKVWLLNEAKRESGGIYLFDDAKSVEGYLNGDIIAAVKKHPALSNISVKTFDILEDFSRVTRAPIDIPIPA
jgi:Putative mono-oxygenase ydhR